VRTTTATIAAVLLTAAGAHADGCTRNHELYRIVPEYRAVLLDGGNIKRVMFVDWKDERLGTWKPSHNITFCPDENKMVNTTINSVATLLSEFATTCKTHLISDAIDRSLQAAWDYTNKPDGGDPSTPLPQANAHAMIRRRASAAGIKTQVGNHTFRATGITAYLKNAGTLENAAAMANHASTRTTQLYDRRRDEVNLDEVERIAI
jgi:hypothetical protein